jgi:drug/metabolite transporter (DMT)-like permease
MGFLTGEVWEDVVKRFLEPIQAIAAVQGQSARRQGSMLIIGFLMFINQVMNVGATTSFALSGGSATLRGFILWQIIGGVFGLGSQLTFAGLVRVSSVKLATAVGIGMAFVSAELFSAYRIFNEPFTRLQWLGVALVGSGVLFIALGKR